MARNLSPSIVFKQQNVLLVEDEAFSRALVAGMLEAIGFGRVLLAESAQQAIDILSRDTINAVITDFRMKGMHGLDLLKAIRTGKTAAPRDLPCALLTTHAERRLVALAIVLDVDTFLVKPVSPNTLSTHLAHCLQQRLVPLEIGAYESIDVENAAPHLAIPEAPPARPTKDDPPPEGWSRLGAKPPEKPERAHSPVPPSVAKPAPAPSAVKSAPPPSVRASSAINPCSNGEKKVDLSAVQEDAILSRNVVGSGGTLLLAAGTRFKSRYAKRLEELRGIEGSIAQVWICQ